MAIDYYSLGQPFEIAVTVPISNHRLLYPSRIQSEFNSAYTAGTGITLSNNGSLLTNTTIDAKDNNENLISIDRLNLYAKALDSVKFGTSNDTDDAGKTERGALSAFDGTNPEYAFDVANALTYDYAAGDNIEIITESFPAGWSWVGDESTISSFNRVRGRLSNFALEWIYANNTSLSQLRHYLASAFLYATAYRAGFWAKGSRSATDADSFAGLRIFNSTDGNFINLGLNDSDLDSTAWKMMVLSGTSTVNSGDFYIEAFNGNGNDGTQTDILSVDEFFLEHSYYPALDKTVGELLGDASLTSNGYFAFSNPNNTSEEIVPDLGSLNINEYESTQQIRLQNGTIKQIDLSGIGQRVEKFILNCNFSNVPSAFYDALKEYERIQKDDYLLNLHPYIDELPSTMTGIMKLGKPSYDNWNLGLVSFSFQFLEG